MLRALLLLLLLPGLALADIVLHDGGVDRDADVVELVRSRTGSKPRLVLSSDVLAGPTRLLASNATLEQCEGAPIRLELKPKLDGVIDSVLSFELEQAISELDVIETLLPCAAAPVAAEDLARLAFLRGAARFDQGDTDGARHPRREPRLPRAEAVVGEGLCPQTRDSIQYALPVLLERR